MLKLHKNITKRNDCISHYTMKEKLEPMFFHLCRYIHVFFLLLLIIYEKIEQVNVCKVNNDHFMYCKLFTSKNFRFLACCISLQNASGCFFESTYILVKWIMFYMAPLGYLLSFLFFYGVTPVVILLLLV